MKISEGIDFVIMFFSSEIKREINEDDDNNDKKQ